VATYLARSAWTSTSAAGSSLSGSKLRGVAIHWPGTTQDIIGDPGQESIASRIRSYRNFHVNTRGWSDIGYNFAIDQAGRVWMLRSTSWAGNRVGAHCASQANPDANHEYVGVLLILGDQEQPSAKMIAAFNDWYRNRFLPVWMGRTDVRGHGKVPGASTSCPGGRALTLIASGAFTSGVTAPPPEEDDMTAEEVWGHTIAFDLKAGTMLSNARTHALEARTNAANAEEQARAANAKADAILAALQNVPGVDAAALAAAVAAAVNDTVTHAVNITVTQD
jgi:hypothetical protein